MNTLYKKLIYIICSFFILAFLVGCQSKPIQISGEIFIVTQGAGNYKMGLVEVRAYNAQDFRTHIDTLDRRLYHQKRTTDSLITEASKGLTFLAQEVVETRNLRNTTRSSNYSYGLYRSASDLYELTKNILEESYDMIQSLRVAYPRYIIESIIENAPSTTTISKTNSDGTFSMYLHPKVEYILVANGSRRVWGKTEEYVWLITHKVDTKNNEPLILSNDNLLGITANNVDIFNLKRFALIGETSGERLAKTELERR